MASVPDHPYRILINRVSGSGKTHSSFNLVSYQLVINKIYIYTNDPYESKYQVLIKKRDNTGLKHLNDSKAFFEY